MADERASCGVVIGVTGAPGSGKTTVGRMFADLGAEIVSLDAIGHELLGEEDVSEEIRRTFSSGVCRILDGEISRRKLADVVFADAAELEKLKRILHPRMVDRVKARLAEWREAGPREGAMGFVIEGALLIEMSLAGLCDRVVLVTVPREERLARLSSSRGWDAEELARREDQQLDEAGRRAHANAVVENVADSDEVRHRVKALWEEWT
ncbi:MAG: dephospho-CoA kinase [Planctomycetota bacterium]|jgi:dephospho-CoA kinase